MLPVFWGFSSNAHIRHYIRLSIFREFSKQSLSELLSVCISTRMCLWSQKNKSLQTPGGGGGGGAGSGVQREQREERLTVCSVTSQDPACTLLSRTSTCAAAAAAAHLEEREAELELQRLEKKDEPREAAASERWQHFL